MNIIEKKDSDFLRGGPPKKGTVLTLCHLLLGPNLGFLFQFWLRAPSFKGPLYGIDILDPNARFNAQGIENLRI
jgi:hypothetical protein